MKSKKLIRYRMPVSVKFPANHKRAGNPTVFVEKIKFGLNYIEDYKTPCNICDRFKLKTLCNECCEFPKKIHTIRANYQLWGKRFEKINKGEAVLELYYWSGKPYNSKCITICQLGKDDGIGLQKLTFIKGDFDIPMADYEWNSPYLTADIALNDGLSYDDFKDWFKGYDLSEPMAIIHFTSFRY